MAGEESRQAKLRFLYQASVTMAGQSLQLASYFNSCLVDVESNGYRYVRDDSMFCKSCGRLQTPQNSVQRILSRKKPMRRRRNNEGRCVGRNQCGHDSHLSSLFLTDDKVDSNDITITTKDSLVQSHNIPITPAFQKKEERNSNKQLKESLNLLVANADSESNCKTPNMRSGSKYSRYPRIVRRCLSCKTRRVWRCYPPHNPRKKKNSNSYARQRVSHRMRKSVGSPYSSTDLYSSKSLTPIASTVVSTPLLSKSAKKRMRGAYKMSLRAKVEKGQNSKGKEEKGLLAFLSSV